MFFESPQFGEHFCPKNSSQHQTSTACIRTCRRNRATPPLPRSPVRFLTSTPKPRAEGSSPSAPAKMRVPRPCENRMVWGFFAPMLTRTRSSFSKLMPHLALSCRTRWQLVLTAVFPSSTWIAPRFALFGRFRVRFSLFRCFLAAKFSASFCLLCR